MNLELERLGLTGTSMNLRRSKLTSFLREDYFDKEANYSRLRTRVQHN